MTNLEQIQKVRMEAFKYATAHWKIQTPIPMILDFLSESIRIAYEAGMEVYYRPNETISLPKYERARSEGYQSGLERAKELINPIKEKYSPSRSAHYCTDEILTALDDELKKL